MNLSPNKSTQERCPHRLVETLRSCCEPRTCAFNRHGTVLAIGCSKGHIQLWDFPEKCVILTLIGHEKPVFCLSWSRSGKKLLSVSTDNTIRLWKVLVEQKEKIYKFPDCISRIQFHPRNDDYFLISLKNQPAIIVDIRGVFSNVPVVNEGDIGVIASFSRRGDFVFTGNKNGEILIMSFMGLSVIYSFKIGNLAILGIECSKFSDGFMVNCSDSKIRVYNWIEVTQDDFDPVLILRHLYRRITWTKCCYSNDGYYICAGSPDTNAVYIWERHTGKLVKEFKREMDDYLSDVFWHPTKPILLSTGIQGIMIWGTDILRRWEEIPADNGSDQPFNPSDEYKRKSIYLETSDIDWNFHHISSDEEGVSPDVLPLFCRSSSESDYDNNEDTDFSRDS